MIKDIQRLIFDPSCYACNRLLSEQESQVCFYCLSQMEESFFHLRPLDNELYRRFAGKFPLEGASCLFFYDKAGRFQQLMQALKYRQSPQLGTYLGSYMASSWTGTSFLEGIEAIIPVPLHWQKLAKRGYNQAELIARGITELCGIPTDCHTLYRRRKTQTQARKTGAARWKNVEGAFGLRKRLPSSVLLVDDVVTTGSTLEACARTMLESQPDVKIKIACLGMARG